MPKTSELPAEPAPAKAPLPETLTAEDIAEMLAEAAELDIYFQTGIPPRARAMLLRRLAG
jgi:hypothetical protein